MLKKIYKRVSCGEQSIVSVLGFSFSYSKSDKTIRLFEHSRLIRENEIENRRNLGFKGEKTKQSILFVASRFGRMGGVQTRLLSYAKKLQENGINVYILSLKNENEDLRMLPNFKLNYLARNFNQCLTSIIDANNISHVEFQLTNSLLLNNVDVCAIREKCKVGIVVHAFVRRAALKATEFDYEIVVTPGIRNFNSPYLDNAKVILNAITKHEKVFEFCCQRTAIFVSRIDREKVPAIESFINFCLDVGVNFKIAGEEKNGRNDIASMLKDKYQLNDAVFIGGIDTISYLIQNKRKYLFVSGIGQVVIEAGALGYPVFLASHQGKDKSVFLTPDKANFFKSRNFTLNKVFDQKNVHFEEIEEKYADMKNIMSGQTSKYCLHSFMAEFCDFDAAFLEYADLLGIKIKQSDKSFSENEGTHLP